MKKLLLVLIGLSIIGMFALNRFYKNALRYALNPDSESRATVLIKKGDTASEIAELLLEKKLIKSPLVFKWYLRGRRWSDDLKAGRFVLQEKNTLPEIVTALVEGRGQELSVTLLEGWTARQMGQALESLGLTTADAFTACVKTCAIKSTWASKGNKEGYLYPETYYVNPDTYSDEAFVGRLVRTLESRLTDDDFAALKKSGRTLSDVLIMASIVEREERSEKERPVVAGILWKRFDNKIGLAADATLLYALGRTKGGLSYNDLQLDSPYNLRKYRGLPPTSISNPSIGSIRATLSPALSPYLYYLHGSDGQVHYGKTLEEHNENKRRYL